MKFQLSPYFIGSGSAASAIEKGLKILSVTDPSLAIAEPVRIKRGETLPDVKTLGVKNPVLVIASPHGLHTAALLQAERAGFALVFCEKPVAVSKEQVSELSSLKVPVAVFHGYRMSWGIQKLKALIEMGEFGEVFAIDGRYLQSSLATQNILGKKKDSWKDDSKISGPFDVALDLATHWTDLAFYLVGRPADHSQVKKSYVGAPTPHRDTHVWLTLDWETPHAIRATATVSKMIHGARNDLEISIFGSKASATWRFMNPDEIELGYGDTRKIIRRDNQELGLKQWSFHGGGWIEGYVEILRQGIRSLQSENKPTYPSLKESLDVLKVIL